MKLTKSVGINATSRTIEDLRMAISFGILGYLEMKRERDGTFDKEKEDRLERWGILYSALEKTQEEESDSIHIRVDFKD